MFAVLMHSRTLNERVTLTQMRRTMSALVGGGLPQVALTLFYLLASGLDISVHGFKVDSVVDV